jgi:DNA modification methylase
MLDGDALVPTARYNEQLARIDWDFIDDQSESASSHFHWHPSRFVSQIPANLLSVLCPKGGTVLDPFCGSGTTLVEAQRLGLVPIGIDLNPISCLISRAKTIPLRAYEIEQIVSDAFERVSRAVYLSRSNDSNARAPNSVQLGKWYSPGVGRQLVEMWLAITSTTGLEHDILAASFSSILLGACRETRHWGYVCDNTTPRDQREKDCLSEFKSRLDLLVSAYRKRDEFMLARSGKCEPIKQAATICDDARQIGSYLAPESADVVLTSPPYFGVSDYIKSQRLSFEWFGYEIEPRRVREIGARSKRHRLTAVSDYNDEMRSVVEGARTALKRGGLAIIVMGESKARQSVVEDFKNTSKLCGLKLDHELRRTISFRRRQHPSISKECILVFTRR